MCQFVAARGKLDDNLLVGSVEVAVNMAEFAIHATVIGL
jgi:hypothetical protein